MAYRRILCAVDFSDRSNTAFYRAIEAAQKYSASLFILHALEVHPLTTWITPEGLSELTMEIEHKAQDAMDSLVSSVEGQLEHLNVRTEITSGRAYSEILENARVWNADLIVMGARGTGALEEGPLGSTVDRVVNDAECSVLVVKG
jgi:nucleotide-binding universal stress UspA family protein